MAEPEICGTLKDSGRELNSCDTAIAVDVVDGPTIPGIMKEEDVVVAKGGKIMKMALVILITTITLLLLFQSILL